MAVSVPHTKREALSSGVQGWQGLGASWPGSHPSRTLEQEPGTWERPSGSEWTHLNMSDREAVAQSCSWEDGDSFLEHLHSG